MISTRTCRTSSLCCFFERGRDPCPLLVYDGAPGTEMTTLVCLFSGQVASDDVLAAIGSAHA